MLQIGAASLLQIRASFITNWGCYYKLGQPLLQNRAAITNWGKMVVYHFINSFGNISILWKCILLHFLFTDYFLCTSNTILWRGFICEICKLRLKWKTCRIFAHENTGWSVSIMYPTLKQQKRALLLAIEITYWGYKLTYEFRSMFAILAIKFWIFISNRRKFRPLLKNSKFKFPLKNQTCLNITNSS